MIYLREILEELEDKQLAPYGFRSRDSKGREYPDPEREYRTAFQRDRYPSSGCSLEPGKTWSF